MLAPPIWYLPTGKVIFYHSFAKVFKSVINAINDMPTRGDPQGKSVDDMTYNLKAIPILTFRERSVTCMSLSVLLTEGIASIHPMLIAHRVNFHQNEVVHLAGRDQITYNFNSSYDSVQERRKITDWLSPLNFKAYQSEFIQIREPGTGHWLLECEAFQAWRNGRSQTLWCPGNPGVGKTILASIVVNHLQMFFEDTNVGIVFIYCNYKEQVTQNITHLIASLLKQLVQDRGAISDNVKSFHHYHQTRSTYPTLEELTKALEVEVGAYSKVFIIVDALDECTETNECRIKLLKALRSLSGPINLMVTSRDLPSIEQHFRDAQRLHVHATDEDVAKYVQSRLANYPDLVDLRDTITAQIVDKSRGMFLLARLHLNALVEQDCEEAVVHVLENLPNEIDQIYHEAMERIERQPNTKELAKRVLSWIIYACRPLSVEELQCALAVSPRMRKMDPRALVFKRKLISVCAGLVVIDKEQHVIRLSHYTTQQYFENHRESRFLDAEATIAAACLQYLSFDVFACGYCEDDDDFGFLLKDNPFFDYAARNWGHHARQHQKNIRDLAMKFLGHDSKVACASQVMLASVQPRFRLGRKLAGKFSGVHMSAYWGLEEIIHRQLENGRDPNNVDSDGRTPLLYAASNGHEAVVELLLSRNDVNADLKANNGRTPLSFAAEEGHEAVVKLLLTREDVDAGSKANNDQTPLSFAAEYGREAVVRQLLARDDVEADSKDKDGETPLSLAAWAGHEEVVKLLLARKDVDADSVASGGQTPLSFAAEEGHEAIVKLLLTRGNVNADSKDSCSRTPLSYAAWRGHEAVVKQLIARDDVEVDSKDEDCETPLHYAAWGGREAVVKLLLARHDVKMDLKDRDGQTALSLAAEFGHEATARLLLARDDVEADSRDEDGQTPLSLAACTGREAVAKLLLTRGDVDPNSIANSGQTPLSFAAEGGHHAVVRLLLAQDNVEADPKDSRGRTPLSHAAGGGHEAIVKLLLTRNDVERDSEDLNERTPLSFAAEEGFEAIVKLLLPRDELHVDTQQSYR